MDSGEYSGESLECDAIVGYSLWNVIENQAYQDSCTKASCINTEHPSALALRAGVQGAPGAKRQARVVIDCLDS